MKIKAAVRAKIEAEKLINKAIVAIAPAEKVRTIIKAITMAAALLRKIRSRKVAKRDRE